MEALADVATLSRASDADLQQLMVRREPDMHDDAARAAAERHAARLGCVLDDVADGCAEVLKGEHETQVRALTPAWTKLLTTSARLSEADEAAIEAASAAFRAVCTTIEPYEEDGGSSSPSDYSDSSSHSRSGSPSGSEESEEDSED